MRNLYRYLTSLNIGDDEFSNRGLSILMLRYNSNLREICFNNTNITTDCLKILNKRFFPKCGSIGVINQKRFQYDQLLK